MRLNWLGKATAAAGALYVAGKVFEHVSQPGEEEEGVVRPCPHCGTSLRIRTSGDKSCPDCRGDFCVDERGAVSVPAPAAPPPRPAAQAPAAAVDHAADCPYCAMNLRFSGHGEKICAGCRRPFFFSAEGEAMALAAYAASRPSPGFTGALVREEKSRFTHCVRVIVALEDGEQAVHVQAAALDRARRPEGKIELFSHSVEREPYGVALFGFASAIEAGIFQRLLESPSMGPSTVLEILSILSVADLRDVVARSDLARLRAVPGIGKMTAERVLKSLQGWLPYQPATGG